MSLDKFNEGLEETYSKKDRTCDFFSRRFFLPYEVVEEIFQDTAMKLYDKRDEYNSNMKFISWFRRIFVNKLIDQKRKSSRRKMKNNIQTEFVDNYINETNIDLSEEVRIGILELEEDKRMMIEMHDYEGLNWLKISDKLKLDNKFTARSKYYQARKELKRVLVERIGEYIRGKKAA